MLRLLRERRDPTDTEADLARFDGLAQRDVRLAQLEARDRRVTERVRGAKFLARTAEIAAIPELDALV